MKAAHWVAGLFVAATFFPAIAFSEPSPQKRTPPPKTAPASPGRKAPPGSITGKAVPRPPATRPPARPAPPRPRAKPPETRTLIFPYYLRDFDFVYQFPYGVYPYPGYAYPPYGYSVPLPGCATPEGETEPTGSVRLDIPQKDAAVYIDGFFVGAVGDVDGPMEPLTLLPGPHHFELRASGFQTATFDVVVRADKTITYRTPMLPVS